MTTMTAHYHDSNADEARAANAEMAEDFGTAPSLIAWPRHPQDMNNMTSDTLFKIQRAVYRFADQHPRNDFARSLRDQIHRGRKLSLRQIQAFKRMKDGFEARDNARGADDNARAHGGTKFLNLLGALRQARESIKYPKLRFQTDDGQKVVLALTGPASRRPGTVNVTDGRPYGDNQWFGRIEDDGTWTPARSCPTDVAELLRTINTDPKSHAAATGQRFGTCCCCGRELTNPDSIAAGIGPICASRFF